MEPKERRASPATLSPKWPDQPSTNPAGEAARRFTVNLRAAIGDKPVRAVAREAGIDEGTIRKILVGQSWPDLRTIWGLESALGAELYTR